MNQKSINLTRRKFLGDAATITALGALGVSAVVSGCDRKPTYVAPVYRDRAPDGPILKACPEELIMGYYNIPVDLLYRVRKEEDQEPDK